MDTARTPLPHQHVWWQLAFTGFDRAVLDKRKAHWLRIAEEVLDKLTSGNVAIVAETSAGKTVVALLAAYALNKPTLFLAPAKRLVGQHAQLFGKIVGSNSLVCSYTGETARGKRLWHDSQRPFVFATPHVVVNALPKGFVDLSQYGLIIVDECHRCVGRYPYVQIAKLANGLGIPMIGLTASLGKRHKSEEVLRTLNVAEHHLLRPTVPTAKKVESSIIVPVGRILTEVDTHLTAMLLELNQTFAQFGFDPHSSKVLSMRELEALKASIQKASDLGDPYIGAAYSAHARYFKLVYTRITIMTECFEAFLRYVNKLENVDPSGAARAILADPRFQQVVRIARANLQLHPKVNAYVDNQCSLHRAGVTVLTFVAQKETARALAQRLADYGIAVATIFGGKDKNVKQQLTTLGQLERGEITSLIATSVLEEGMNLPEVGAVVHYSVPMTAGQRIQRSGRTGRIRTGSVIFTALEHPLDTVFLYVTREKPEILPLPPVNLFDRKITRIRTRKRNRCDPQTLDLFTQPQPI